MQTLDESTRQRHINTKILFVDDDQNMLLILRDLFEFWGYQVNTAESGEDALRILAQILPDIIISNIGMPMMDGYELVRYIREELNIKIPIIFLSAKEKIEAKLRGLAEGADFYMVKPFEPYELMANIDDLIEKKPIEIEVLRFKQIILLQEEIIRKLLVGRAETNIYS